MKNKIHLNPSLIDELNLMQKNEDFWQEIGYPTHNVAPPNMESESLYMPGDEDLPFQPLHFRMLPGRFGL